MIVSWNWLTDYLRLDMPVEVLTERLALTGLNLEIDRRRRRRHRHRPGGHEQPSRLPGPPRRRPRDLRPLRQGPLRPRPAAVDRRGRRSRRRTAVTVEEAELCPRFTARVVSGVKVGESPWWLRKRLETIGVRPISNIVDVTNYVMFECGQPLHAYDLDRLAERRLVVRRARAGETLTAINNKVYELTPEMLVDRRRRASGRPGRRDGRAWRPRSAPARPTS